MLVKVLSKEDLFDQLSVGYMHVETLFFFFLELTENL